MVNLESNYVFIDGANLHKGIGELGWDLDYVRFRRWLTEKFQTSKAFIFMGFRAENRNLYNYLRQAGFVIIFKQIIYEEGGKLKSNCDSELVLRVIVDYYEKRFNKAVLIPSDGNFACLATFLLNKKALRIIIAPNNKKCSFLIRKIQGPPAVFERV